MASAPQQRAGRRCASARKPAAATARIVARWAGRKATSMTQPDSTLADRARAQRPRAIGSRSSRRLTGGVVARWAAGASRSSRSARADGQHPAGAHHQVPVAAARPRGPSALDPARGHGPGGLGLGAGRLDHAAEGDAAGARRLAGPAGEALVHHRGERGVDLGVRPPPPPAWRRCARAGEAVSRPVRRKVGQCGRQSPHATHLTTSSSAGAGSEGSQFEVTPTGACPG